ncbi:LCP family protein [Phytomonospora endophytica]|uniref:LCP family protein required for cell wall assembly n=1 Tax=Phytomonospora endophytica TaxID=714109 RepID=A0A841F674_9ACTN|nr:LCP family protein [Phytomonospora endophytica]MBB6032431.1 LCP family protein required for cell wall assembly [Phytomonospora endophytica]GIG66422.1 transcriptional regulator [Phytomonospora endophytica]
MAGRRRRSARKPLWAKILVATGAFLMVVAGGAVVYANVMFDKVNDAAQQACLLDDCTAYQPGEEVTGPLNFLLVGSDMRKDWSAAQSDSIMILHVNADLSAANIVSIPRDLEVTIPDCGNGAPCDDKINAAFSVGGTDMKKAVSSLAATLTDLTGVKFDGAAMINFGGFEDVVELLGGVELCVPFDMDLEHPKDADGNKPHVKKGCREYEPKLALGIVRERYAYDYDNPNWDPKYGVGDYGRQRMQQHFIKQLLKKAKAEGYMTNVFKVGELIDKIGDQILLDLKGRQVTDLAFALTDIDASKLTTLKVPSDSVKENEIWYVRTLPEHEKAAESLYKAIRDDDLATWTLENPDWVNKTG